MKTKMIRRVAVVVLAIALLTTTVLCGTMAKYTSSFNGFDATVTIAKYDVKLNGQTSAAYNATDITVDPVALATDTQANDVVASGKFAPGMYAKVAELEIVNNSDVAVAFRMVQDGNETENGAITAGEGMPENAKLVVLKSGDAALSDGTIDAADLEAAAEAAEGTTWNGTLGYKQDGQDAASAKVYIYVVWAYETGSTDDAKATNNGTDTTDGTDAAKATDDVSTFTVTIPKIVVEQVEPVAAAPATT